MVETKFKYVFYNPSVDKGYMRLPKFQDNSYTYAQEKYLWVGSALPARAKSDLKHKYPIWQFYYNQ